MFNKGGTIVIPSVYRYTRTQPALVLRNDTQLTLKPLHLGYAASQTAGSTTLLAFTIPLVPVCSIIYHSFSQFEIK